jgi:hypothetical protein
MKKIIYIILSINGLLIYSYGQTVVKDAYDFPVK